VHAISLKSGVIDNKVGNLTILCRSRDIAPTQCLRDRLQHDQIAPAQSYTSTRKRVERARRARGGSRASCWRWRTAAPTARPGPRPRRGAPPSAAPEWAAGGRRVPHTVLESRVSKLANSDTCPRPTTQPRRGARRAPGQARAGVGALGAQGPPRALRRLAVAAGADGVLAPLPRSVSHGSSLWIAVDCCSCCTGSMTLTGWTWPRGTL
jgi:hypothetical protein